MTEPEKEALQNILFALFLESPKRKEAIRHQEKRERQQSPPGNILKSRKYQTGEKQHGYVPEESKAAVYH